MTKTGKTSRSAKSAGDAAVKSIKIAAPAKWRQARRRLMHLRCFLLAGPTDLQAGLGGDTGHNGRRQSSAAARFDRDLALTLLRSEQCAIAEVDAALLRIRQGTYGICEQSGEAIPRERLDLIPWARFTAEVQAAMENEAESSTMPLKPAFQNQSSSQGPPPG